MTSTLDKIAASTVLRVAERRGRRGLDAIRADASAARVRTALSLRQALGAEPFPRVIAEVKLASPSEGPIAPDADPLSVAAAYVANGAAALSILTEPKFFGGRMEYLTAIRAQHADVPLLMKDFVVDEYQIYEARAAGADALLLIMALLGRERVREFMAIATSLGMESLVEVHDEAELRAAAEVGPPLIGVNNRDLKTLRVSLGVSERLAGLAPANATLVAESGLREGSDLRRLAALGYRGFLIGTSFMRSPEPGAALARLMREARSA